MKILWSSNAPWSATGYANQTKLFTPRLKKAGHDVAIHAWYGLEGGVLNWNGMHVYPKYLHQFGADIMGAHAAHFQADICITLIDAWVMEPKFYGPNVRWCPWYPVDMTPIPPPVAAKVAQSFAPIVYSQFGLRESRKAGIDALYVPHGVDTTTFAPGNKAKARERLNWPKDKYIVGMIAANKGTPSRKAFPQQIEGFAKFHKRHPDSVLYLHTNKGDMGEMQSVNLPELVLALGLTLGEDVFFCDAYAQVIGYPDEYMTSVYSGLDVLLSAGMGEGFGIPILEAQACGCPVIVGDWTAMSELFFDGVLIPESEADRFWMPLAAYQYLPRIGAIEAALCEAYGKTADRETMRAKAMQYDADVVTNRYWQPALKDIQERIEKVTA